MPNAALRDFMNFLQVSGPSVGRSNRSPRLLFGGGNPDVAPETLPLADIVRRLEDLQQGSYGVDQPGTMLYPYQNEAGEELRVLEQELLNRQGGGRTPQGAPPDLSTLEEARRRGLQATTTTTRKVVPEGAPAPSKFLSTQELTDLLSTIQALPAVQGQQADTDALKELMAQSVEATPPQMDLSPLAALSDTWFGGNLSKGIPTQPTVGEAQARALATAGAGRKAGTEDLDTILEFVKAAKTSSLANLLAGTQTDRFQTPPDNSGQMSNAGFRALTQFRQVSDPLRKRIDSATTARNLLAAGSTAGDASFKRELLTIMGEDKFTEHDIRAVRGSAHVWDTIMQGVETNFKSGAFTVKNREMMENVIRILETAAKNRLKNLAGGQAKSISRFSGLSEDMLRQSFTESFGEGFFDERKEAPPAQDPEIETAKKFLELKQRNQDARERLLKLYEGK